jgi:hypothetical protein
MAGQPIVVPAGLSDFQFDAGLLFMLPRRPFKWQLIAGTSRHKVPPSADLF